jgi:hypothetical protein
LRTEARESVEPVCPFCRKPIARPAEITISPIERVLGGKCSSCGALYLVDLTSRNVGEVMLQALDLASKELSKEASDMVAGEDYDDVILSYDWRRHRSSGEPRSFMDRHGRMYFLKIKKKQ